MADHLLQLYSPTGEYLFDPLAFISIDVTLAEKNPGIMTIALFPDYPDNFFQRDGRIAFYRSPPGHGSLGMRLVGDTYWLITSRSRIQDENGQHRIVLECVHPNEILRRRVVAYNEGSANAKFADIASDVLYDIVDQNVGPSATDTARRLSTNHFVLEARPGPTFGTTAYIDASYRTVLDVMQDICNASAEEDTYIGFEVHCPQMPGPLRYRIYYRLRGTDRGFSSGQTIILDPSTTDMRSRSVRESWDHAVSFVYAGGAGQKDERIVETAEDTQLSGMSPFARYEYFQSVSSDDAFTVGYAASQALRDFRPIRSFESALGGGSRRYTYGVDYDWGDIVGARFYAPIAQSGFVEYLFDCRVDPVHIQVARQFDERGRDLGVEETIDVQLRSIASIG